MESMENNLSVLTDEKKVDLRRLILVEAKKLLGIPYEYGAEWTDYTKPPHALDCSEMIEGIFKIVGLPMPDGAQAQFNFTLATDHPLPGDLAFFGKGKDINQIYHVGLVFDEMFMIEARAFDPTAKFETGKVILRPQTAWENYHNFAGYRCFPKLA